MRYTAAFSILFASLFTTGARAANCPTFDASRTFTCNTFQGRSRVPDPSVAPFYLNIRNGTVDGVESFEVTRNGRKLTFVANGQPTTYGSITLSATCENGRLVTRRTENGVTLVDQFYSEGGGIVRLGLRQEGTGLLAVDRNSCSYQAQPKAQ